MGTMRASYSGVLASAGGPGPPPPGRTSAIGLDFMRAMLADVHFDQGRVNPLSKEQLPRSLFRNYEGLFVQGGLLYPGPGFLDRCC